MGAVWSASTIGFRSAKAEFDWLATSCDLHHQEHPTHLGHRTQGGEKIESPTNNDENRGFPMKPFQTILALAEKIAEER